MKRLLLPLLVLSLGASQPIGSSRSIPQAHIYPSPAETILRLNSTMLSSHEYFILGAPEQDDGRIELEKILEYADPGGSLPGSKRNRTSNTPTDPESPSYYTSADSRIVVAYVRDSLAAMTANPQVTRAPAFDVYLPLVFRNYTAPVPPPMAPTGLSATPISQTRIDLLWSDMSSDETNFRIERSPDGTSSWVEIGTSPADTPSFSSLGLTCGTPYYYRVRAYRAGDSQFSGYSNSANATTSACGAWTIISSVDFEGPFPGGWTVLDRNGGSYGEYFWEMSTCRPGSGSYSGWGVGGGANGSALGCGANYPDYAYSWMKYGPFSLVGATEADLSFEVWTNTESNRDYVCRWASTNGTDYLGLCTSGNTGGFVPITLDLSSYLGWANVWVAISFDSNGSVNYAEGGYVDNIVLRKCMTGSCPTSLPFDVLSDAMRSEVWAGE